ncbi:MAG TPA: DUF523 and DUF1722 domain-containing protein [Bacteroidota bacterium]|nr:DUF523 and DUF1722 domain-containing protein [Bacteroidota bacterium]
MEGRMRIGISSCLLGERVRYDGGHKQDRFLTDVLGPYVEWVPVCPELEVGMGVPREAVRLVASASAPRMVGIDSGEDWTDRMLAYSKRRVEQIGKLKLSGYVLKSKSPSCGTERVKVHYPEGIAEKDQKDRRDGKTRESGKGLFAGILIKGHPLLPVEEEGRLNDPHLRENFIVRVFAYHRLQKLMDGKFTVGKLVEFHTAEKFLLLAHSPKHYRKLGPLVASAKKTPVAVLKRKYATFYMECLRVRTTVKKNVNVLQHIAGYLPEAFEPGGKKDILQVIENYRLGLLPLVVPVTLLRHSVRAHSIEDLKNQVYLNPHPGELMLRNHV